MMMPQPTPEQVQACIDQYDDAHFAHLSLNQECPWCHLTEAHR